MAARLVPVPGVRSGYLQCRKNAHVHERRISPSVPCFASQANRAATNAAKDSK